MVGAQWFEETKGEELELRAVTPLDVKDYRRFLLVNQGVKPSTVNRRLAALRRLFRWTRGCPIRPPVAAVLGGLFGAAAVYPPVGRGLNRHRARGALSRGRRTRHRTGAGPSG